MGVWSFSGMLASVELRGRRLLSRSRPQNPADTVDVALDLCHAIISARGNNSAAGLAQSILDIWEHLPETGKTAFLVGLAEQFGPDLADVARAVEAVSTDPSEANISLLHAVTQSDRQEIIQRLNKAPGATPRLVAMREFLLDRRKQHPVLNVLDKDFHRSFSSWFNHGFLTLRKINWNTPANVLEKIIRYEAVHEIGDWNELRSRIEPADRRLFAFFHPQMPDEPLIFVEVALTRSIPSAIAPLLSAERNAGDVNDATTAVFYSITNCQRGLHGISFGSFLIKQVTALLKRELPNLKTFVTLSPVPGFGRWLATLRMQGEDARLQGQSLETLALLDCEDWHEDANARAALQPVLERLVATYLLDESDEAGKPLDPVARFHLGNGAILERINFLGDLSPSAIARAHGMMVNYLYDIDRIEKTH